MFFKQTHVFWSVILILLLVTGFYPNKLAAKESPNGSSSSLVSAALFHKSDLIDREEIRQDETEMFRPSKSKAFLLSLLVPGAGEWYAGSNRMARIFFGTEVALWTGFFSFRVYGHWIKHDYELFATSHAGIDADGKDHDYFVAVENYMNIRDYNNAKLQQRQLNEIYPETDEYAWQWDSDASRSKLEKMRDSSDKAFSRSLIVVGGILINHLISGIDAARAANTAGKQESHRIQVGFLGLPEGGAVVSLWKRF